MKKTSIKTIGIEIEGEWTRREINRFTKKKWEIKTDGSIHMCHHDHKKKLNAYEIVSPILQRSHLTQTARTIASISLRDYHWNDTCGFHIHIALKYYPAELLWYNFASFFQKKVKKSYPQEWEKRKTNTYCKPFHSSDQFNSTNSRYHTVNPLAFTEHGTIEIRLFPAAPPPKMAEYLKWTIATIEEFTDIPHKINYKLEIDNLKIVKNFNEKLEKICVN